MTKIDWSKLAQALGATGCALCLSELLEKFGWGALLYGAAAVVLVLAALWSKVYVVHLRIRQFVQEVDQLVRSRCGS